MLLSIKRVIATFVLIRIPSFPGKRRVVRYLNWLFKGAPVRTPYGIDMVVDTSDSTNYFSTTGAYGTTISDVIKEFPSNSAFLDVGANAGLFSLVAAEHFEDGVVISFEPQPVVASALLRNVAMNKFDNVLVLNCAVGAQAGWLSFEPVDHHSGSVHMPNLAANDAENQSTQRALVMSAQYFAGIVKAMTVDRKVVVKIDVEGAECIVAEQLLSLVDCLDIAVFIVEVSEENLQRFGNSRRALYSLFEGHGYHPTISNDEHDLRLYDEIFRLPSNG